MRDTAGAWTAAIAMGMERRDMNLEFSSISWSP
jgi:hypothetical protein